MRRLRVGMQGVGWESVCGESAWECGKSGWKYKNCEELWWRCRESS